LNINNHFPIILKHTFMDNQLEVFDNKPIRRVEYNGELYFAVIDIISVLIETTSPSQYWTKVKKHLISESQLQPFWLQLKTMASDGKNYKTDCANTEGVFRILMSVPSPKAEPFKLWLAQVGKQMIVEAENPELGFERLTKIYTAKGYSKEWVAQRLKTIEVRKELTDEWKNRGVKDGQEYSILTATIAKGTFGLNPSEHAKFKGLERQNLRDNMTNLELIFTALSEEITRTIATNEDAQGFNENLDAAQQGGQAAGNARLQVERVKGVKVVSSDNFLSLKGGDAPSELPEEGKD
jgi:DNA-damage-inducible protein D